MIYLGHREEDNIKMVPRETGCGDVDWIYLGRNRFKRLAVVNTIMKLWFP